MSLSDYECALRDLANTVRRLGLEDVVERCALELADKDDVEFKEELAKASRELCEIVTRSAPDMSPRVVNGLVIGFCELVNERRRELLTDAGGHA